MTLNKREKALLILLGIILLIIGIYKFIYTPSQEKLKKLIYDRENKEIQYIDMQGKFEMANSIKGNILDYEYNLLNSAKYLLGSLEQEDIILILNDLVLENNMEVLSIHFMEESQEALLDENMGDDIERVDDEEETPRAYPETKIHSVKINYETKYEGLIDFLKSIREYDKRIIIKDIDINNNHNGMLSGSIIIDFYTLDIVDKYVVDQDTDNILYYGQEFFSDGEEVRNPFDTYEDFIEEGYDGGDDELILENDHIEEVPTRKMIDLYGFESDNIFFIGKPKDVYGKVSLNTNSIQGKYSNRIEYDFIRSRDYSEANLVFDGNPIEIKKQPESISISIFPYETNKHNIGILLIDSYGREFRIPLTNELSLKGWNTIEVVMPMDITYPARLQRVYIESESFSDKLKGDFLLDNLQLYYNED